MIYKNITTLKTCLIKDVLPILEQSPFHMCVIVDEDERVIGTVTDGDVRRGLMKGLSLNTEAFLFMSQNPVFVFDTSLQSDIEKKFIDTKIEKLLVLNASFHLVNIIENKNLSKQLYHDYPVVIMAGGKGKRLWPLTKETPKPMLHIGGKPLLEHIIDTLSKEEFYNFYISVHYKSHIIKDYFLDGAHKNININYLEEKESLGTAGALSLIDDVIEKPMIIMNGDVLCDIKFCNIIKYHEEQGNDITVCVREYSVEVPYGVIECDAYQKICTLQEKPRIDFHINSGIYIINPSILKHLKKNEHIDMTDLILNLISKNKNCGIFPLMESWIDVGRKDDLERAQKMLHTRIQSL